MPLKNSDGTVYRLSHPNPIVIGQEKWDARTLVLHNQYGKADFLEGKKEINMPAAREPTFLEALREPTKEEPKIDKPKIFENRPDNIVIVHCMPAIKETVKDELYGETFTRTSWGSKVTFEAIIISLSDLMIELWTTYSIAEGSIAYPARYASAQIFSERRWWKISAKEKKEGGFLVRGVPSIEQPEFTA